MTLNTTDVTKIQDKTGLIVVEEEVEAGEVGMGGERVVGDASRWGHNVSMIPQWSVCVYCITDVD